MQSKEPIKQIFFDKDIMLNCVGGMGASGKSRYIEVFDIDDDKDKIQLVFKRFDYYNGRPAEGGGMCATRDVGSIVVDAETASLSDEEIIDKYNYVFDEYSKAEQTEIERKKELSKVPEPPRKTEKKKHWWNRWGC
ncbi:MAG: hypothetical protein IKO44_02010 [Ruminococcus sp.]|nr:hypothetical protein [Ruminococcus sp.]